jgi:dethiobiotin synthetase
MDQACSVFVTGTDTEVGKTLISCALLHALKQSGKRVAGMKPVAAGAVLRDGVWRSEDAELLAAAGSVELPQEVAVPYLLRQAAAPHIVATLENVDIDLAHIVHSYRRAAELTDAVVVEGIGGFRVPLSARHDTADLARQLELPVILVVGLRLGCLNHALLTAEAIAARGLKLAGWVANGIDPAMSNAEANVEALMQRLEAPVLGVVPWQAVPTAAAAAAHLDLSCLPGWPNGSGRRSAST